MFGVMPTWTDMLGASLVLVTVVSIPFEKFINSKLCPATREDKSEEQVETESDVKQEHINDKVWQMLKNTLFLQVNIYILYLTYYLLQI